MGVPILVLSLEPQRLQVVQVNASPRFGNKAVLILARYLHLAGLENQVSGSHGSLHDPTLIRGANHGIEFSGATQRVNLPELAQI